MSNPTSPDGSVCKACIIGARSSGCVAEKTLHERGIPFDCFEIGSGIGGKWSDNGDNGRNLTYKSLHINASHDTMANSDFPQPRDAMPIPSLKNEVSLCHQVVHPGYPGLHFTGLVQPWGAIVPLAEAQAKWISGQLCGSTGLPPRERTLDEIQQNRSEITARYANCAWHTISVGFSHFNVSWPDQFAKADVGPNNH